MILKSCSAERRKLTNGAQASDIQRCMLLTQSPPVSQDESIISGAGLSAPVDEVGNEGNEAWLHQGYWALPPAARLRMLRDLCRDALDTNDLWCGFAAWIRLGCAAHSDLFPQAKMLDEYCRPLCSSMRISAQHGGLLACKH